MTNENQNTEQGVPAPKILSFAGGGNGSNAPLAKRLEGRVEALETLTGLNKSTNRSLKSLPKKLKAVEQRLNTIDQQLQAIVQNYNSLLVELDREPVPSQD